MPQKGQITKHEWDVWGMNWIQRCKVCGCKRELPTARRDHPIYKEFGSGDWKKQEPPCITRKIENDNTNSHTT